MRAALLLLVLFSFLPPCGSASAATCRDPAGFDAWLEKIKQEAVAQGISQRAVEEGLNGVTFDQSVVRHDHGQGVFRQSFEQFSSRMVPPRLGRARVLQKRYAPVFAAVEQRYGVSSPVLLAIWGLETDFGAVTGSYPTVRSVATLAYDCRRSEMFKAELFDALRLIQRGDGTPSSMHGAWAGEIGQTQFMPSTYLKYGVSYGGGSRADLIHNVPDVLASTANFLKNHGWQRGPAGRRANRTSPPSRSGTSRPSTPRRSPISPPGSRTANRPERLRSRPARSPPWCPPTDPSAARPGRSAARGYRPY